MKSKKKTVINFIIAFLVLCMLALIAFSVYFFFIHKKSPANKFDENNVGEIYCAPIDEKHVATDKSGVMFADNEILVVAKDGTEKNDIEKLAKEYKAEIVGYIEQTEDYQLKFSDTYSLDELEKTAEKLEKEEIVSLAEVNYISETSESSVNYDINPGEKWNKGIVSHFIMTGQLKNTGNTGLMWGANVINAPDAWKKMNLIKKNINPVKVGLIDNGFDETHEDLKFADNGVFYDNGENGVDVKYKSKEDGHGTHVAGIMAARGDNTEGICGIYPYGNGKLYGASWVGAESYSENLISCMYEKVTFSELIFRNVKVINCSYGLTTSLYYNNEQRKSQIKKDANILADYLQRLLDKGYDFVIVSSAGNDSSDYVINLSYDYNKDEYNCDESKKTISYDANGMPTVVYKNQNNKYFYSKEDSNGNDVYYEVTGLSNKDQVFYPPDDVTDTSNGHLECKYSSNLNAIDNENIKNRIIVVGAVNKDLNISYYSNAGKRVDVFAPGGDDNQKIYSTVPGNEKYDYKMGTSMAAPHVAGVAADVWSIDNSLSGADVKRIVCESTLKGKVVCEEKETNRDGKKGIVDCYKAVEKAYDGLEKSGKIKEEPQNSAILGWVVDKSDENTKIKNASVSAQLKNSSNNPVETTTDKNGHFELIVPKGEYTITIKAQKEDGYNDYVFDYNVKENGNVYYPDWIKIERNDAEAKKYAEIVMKNENLWLDPLNEMFKDYEKIPDGQSLQCWFEDIDFDGTPEFIVGGCNMGTQGGVCYNIYKFTDEHMFLLTKKNMGNLCSINIYSALTRPDSEFGEYSGEIIKDKNGKYRYLFPTINNSIGYGYNISELSVKDNAIETSTVFGYFYANPNGTPEFIYFTSDNEQNNYTLNEFTEKVDSYFDGAKFCYSEIGTIFCSRLYEEYDSNWWDEVSTSENGLSDGWGSLVSGCYDTLSENEKEQALIKSYNTYKIKETDSVSQLYTTFKDGMKNDYVRIKIPTDAAEYNWHHYYIYSDVCSTWEEAEEYCEALGGHLAIIDDDEENTMLYNLLQESEYENAYFGLSDSKIEGEWECVDGTKPNYTNWSNGEPNNERGVEDYALFYCRSPKYEWNDGDFNHGTGYDSATFICEWDL